MVHFKEIFKSWLLRLAQALEARVAAMDPNTRGVVLGLLVIIIACGAFMPAVMFGRNKIFFSWRQEIQSFARG